MTAQAQSHAIPALAHHQLISARSVMRRQLVPSEKAITAPLAEGCDNRPGLANPGADCHDGHPALILSWQSVPKHRTRSSLADFRLIVLSPLAISFLSLLIKSGR